MSEEFPETQPEPDVQHEPLLVVADEDRVRYEDDPANFPQDPDFVPAELSAEEVPAEESRKDETSVLATDRFNESGERIQ
jgi:hypothetical protein